MFVWSKRLVATLLGLFVLMLAIFFLNTTPEDTSILKEHTTGWMAINYIGLIAWVFVWMIDQARMRGKNFWVWLVPFVLAPLPTLMLFVLFLQRRIQ
jgi:heme A synthase